MEQDKKLLAKELEIEETGNDTKSFDIINAKEFGNQITDIIMGIPPETRRQLSFSVLAQGPGLMFPNSGFGDVKIIPAKIEFIINPIKP